MFIDFREKEKEKEKKRQTEISIDCFPYMQPGIQSAT